MVDKKILLDSAEAELVKALAALDKTALAKAMTDQVVAFNKAAVTFNDKAAAGTPKRVERPMPTQAQIDSQYNSARGAGVEALGKFHLAKGNTDQGIRELQEALALNPASVASVSLADLEAKRGNDKAALAYYLTAATTGRLKPAEDTAFRALYRKVHGSEKNIEKDIDETFEEKFPNPVKAEKWKATDTRTDRVTLAEFFTGSGCPPCVAADYAFEGILDRYPERALIGLVYHVHVPQPDPMTTAAGTARDKFYKVQGVPTFNVDGKLSRLGGGGRDNSKMVYDAFVKDIDKSLETPSGASVITRASRSGNSINVTTTVSKVDPAAKDLTLHVVLAEDQLTFTGENGMRFHPLVVRAMAGNDKPGIPVTLDASGAATLTYTFDLSAIPADITQSLADEIAKRRKTEPAGSTPRDYRAEGKAMVNIDPSSLVVIAFVQDTDHKILQAARVKPGK
jgi:thiol-disulfide isomerase/thioredoxin